MKEELKNNKLTLIKNILNQAEVYLIEIGEFAPFASKLTLDNKIIPVGYFEDDDFIDSKKVINIFKNDLFENKDVILAAIGVDASIKVKGKPKDALLMIISKDGLTWEEIYYPYSIISGKIIWK